jgi:hypothetical protein
MAQAANRMPAASLLAIVAADHHPLAESRSAAVRVCSVSSSTKVGIKLPKMQRITQR